ncbi:MAG: FkbM family methyltransferase [Bacteroidota bacterium]
MQKELDSLLNESISSAEERAKVTFDQMAGAGGKTIILFGCGELGRKTLNGLRKVGVHVACFSDNNSKLWDSEINEVKVLSPEQALEKYPDSIIVLTIWSAYIGHPIEEIQQQLRHKKNDVKVISFIFLYWKYPEVFLPYWRCDLPQKTIEQAKSASIAFSLWSDEISRKEYFGQIYWRITGDSSKLTKPVKSDQYFPEDIFKIDENEVFVDIGAFDGDTLKVFLGKSSGNFKHYYAYEPDPFGYKKLKEFIHELAPDVIGKIDIKPIGIGSKNEKISVETPGVYFKILYPEEAKVQSVKNESPVVDVDSKPLDEMNFTYIPTFVKMDVEGAEPNVISGMKKLIEKHYPVIAISVYHTFDHIWRLPLAVKALSDNYEFYLRPHFYAGWELICYAVPKHRVQNSNQL